MGNRMANNSWGKVHGENGFKPAPRGRAEEKNFISEKQRRARQRFAKDPKDWTIVDWSKIII